MCMHTYMYMHVCVCLLRRQLKTILEWASPLTEEQEKEIKDLFAMYDKGTRKESAERGGSMGSRGI